LPLVQPLPAAGLTGTQLDAVRRIETEDIGCVAGAFGLDPDVNRERAELLAAVAKDAGEWMGPHVVDPSDITGDGGVFWNSASEDGYIKPDPDGSQEGHFTQVDRVTYSVLIPGDRERAIGEAEARLATYGN
jgi:hypothetical protein